jgi:hypothetical protein
MDVQCFQNQNLQTRKPDVLFDYEHMFSLCVVTTHRHSSVGIEMGCGLDSTSSRPAPGHTHTPIQWVPRAISPGVKRPGREADHSVPSSAEVDNCRAPPPLLHMSLKLSLCLISYALCTSTPQYRALR